MISQDKIAAAQIAQIFGSELTQIDEAVTYRSGNTSKAVKVDPKQILLGQASQTPTGNQVLRDLQKEAEAAFPDQQSYQTLPLEHSQHHATVPIPATIKEQVHSATSAQFDKLCSILERLVVVLEGSDVIIKKQSQLRKPLDEARD